MKKSKKILLEGTRAEFKALPVGDYPESYLCIDIDKSTKDHLVFLIKDKYNNITEV